MMSRMLSRRLAVALIVACASGLTAQAPPPPFTDVTKAAGIRFVHNNGNAAGKNYYPETMGSGALFFDADGDGSQDLLLVNGTHFKGEAGPVGLPALYRNTGKGAFVDVTAASGLGVELYGMGGAAADYDNDGREDVYITAFGGGRLFHNVGGGKFVDVTQASRVVDDAWSSSAMWFDYDRDGFVDLIMSRYVEWSPDHNGLCGIPGSKVTFCPPVMYRGFGPRLFHNNRNGTFTDVTAAAGLAESNSRGLGVAMIDVDADGWPDVLLANDTTPNFLRRNNRNGTFTEVGFKAGISVPPGGRPRAGMGIDVGELDGTGRPSVIIGNFSDEVMGVYRNLGEGVFEDVASQSAIGRDTRKSLTFGLFLFDADLDGRLDIFAANGHISDVFPLGMVGAKYAQAPHLFRNLGGGRFEDVVSAAGAELARPVVGRGAAYADIDRDGDLDLVITENKGPARVFRNDLARGAHALRVKLIGTTSNRDAIGARADVVRADGSATWQVVKTGSSYLSQSELPLTFGLGAATSVRSLRITWPDGKMEPLGRVDADQAITVREGQGIADRAPLNRR